MKAGILTFHRATNYGTALQAFATQKACEKIGIDAQLIDYRPEYIERTLKLRRIKNTKSPKEIASICINGILYPGMQKRKSANFLSFMSSMKIGDEVCTTTAQVAQASQKYDTVISGSDQLWNKKITADDMTYFLPFEHKNKVSFASSFGESSLAQDRQKDIAKYLADFKFIGVREKTAVNILSDIEKYASNMKSPECVLDPTLLLDKDDWNSYADKSLILPKGGYILTYYMIETELMRAITKALKKATGLPVINIKPSKKQVLLREGKNLAFAGPSQFLSCYKHASFVVTNSFHGTAFAINYNIPFFTSQLPVSMAGQVNSRLVDILKLFSLEDRWIDSFEKLDKTDVKKPLDAHCAQTLRELRKYSLDCLSKAVGVE